MKKYLTHAQISIESYKRLKNIVTPKGKPRKELMSWAVTRAVDEYCDRMDKEMIK